VGVALFTNLSVTEVGSSAMRITTVKALASRLVVGMAEMKSVIRSKSLEKHTASLIFLHGSGEF